MFQFASKCTKWSSLRSNDKDTFRYSWHFDDKINVDDNFQLEVDVEVTRNSEFKNKGENDWGFFLENEFYTVFTAHFIIVYIENFFFKHQEQEHCHHQGNIRSSVCHLKQK